MKRLSKDMQLRLERIAKRIKRFHNKTLAKQKRKKRKRSSLRNQEIRQTSSRERVRITAPIKFDIENNETRRLMIIFLADLREIYVRNDVTTITLDFTKTEQFVASGTLLFYAELSRLIEITKNNIQLRYNPPRNDKASQVLDQIGIHRMCGGKTNKTKSTIQYGDVVHWRVAHGNIVDNSICATTIENFEGQLALPLLNGLYRGLGEAMTNAKHHAYLNVRKDGLNYKPPRNDWWMFSQAKDGYLSVVFCDLGIGIPNTLPLKKPTLFKKLISLGRACSDSACIEDAIQDSRTRTNFPARGKGLGNIVDVVSKQKNGIVKILSNQGFYYISDKIRQPMTYDLKDSILGTLIFWKVPLTKKLHHDK